jgi:hypothetical protein
VVSTILEGNWPVARMNGQGGEPPVTPPSTGIPTIVIAAAGAAIVSAAILGDAGTKKPKKA